MKNNKSKQVYFLLNRYRVQNLDFPDDRWFSAVVTQIFMTMIDDYEFFLSYFCFTSIFPVFVLQLRNISNKVTCLIILDFLEFK